MNYEGLILYIGYFGSPNSLKNLVIVDNWVYSKKPYQIFSKLGLGSLKVS